VHTPVHQKLLCFQIAIFCSSAVVGLACTSNSIVCLGATVTFLLLCLPSLVDSRSQLLLLLMLLCYSCTDSVGAWPHSYIKALANVYTMTPGWRSKLQLLSAAFGSQNHGSTCHPRMPANAVTNSVIQQPCGWQQVLLLLQVHAHIGACCICLDLAPWPPCA
jgi:hypothetical protein